MQIWSNLLIFARIYPKEDTMKICSLQRGKESVTEFYLIVKGIVELLNEHTKKTIKVFYHSTPERVIDHADIWATEE
jgi:hypothetical protein